MRLYITFALLAVLVYGLTVLALWYFQRSLIYQPNHNGRINMPLPAHAPFQNLDVVTSDGIDLRGWYQPAKAGMPTIVYFHGNVDRLPDTLHYHDLLTDMGYGLLLTSYRGFSGHAGTPTEEGLYKDASAYIEGLLKRGVKQDDLIIYGFSLGTGVATEMAVRYPPRGLVLASPFSTLARAAGARYPIIPVELLLKDQFRSVEKIGQVDAPILIVNGRQDYIFPYTEGDLLAKAARADRVTYKTFKGGHVRFFFDHGGDRYIAQWFKEQFGSKEQ